MTAVVRGLLDPYWETGTEGVIWALHDPSLPGYDGLITLANGDHLTIVGHDRQPLWSGVVALEYERRKLQQGVRVQQEVGGFWVHGLQQDIEPDTWSDWFSQHLRAVLRKATPEKPHPFHAPSRCIVPRLRAGLTDEAAQRMFKAALYTSLRSDSDDGGWDSFAKPWGFDLAEVRRLIGNPTDEQITAWMIYPRRSTDTLMPFNWTLFGRLALLYGVRGGLVWRFGAAIEEAVAWLNQPLADGRIPKQLLLGDDLAGIAAVRDALAPETEPG